MRKTIQQSANSYAVVAGEVIDNTSCSAFLVKPWRAIKHTGQIEDFATKEEAINWVLRG